MFEEKRMQQFAEAVAAWVKYQVVCGREHMLSEKMLRIPITEFAQAQ